MSERDRGLAIAMLAEAFSVCDLTPAKIRIYDQALKDLPVAILEPMVQKAIKSRTWFPKVAELLADAEAVRLEMVRALGDYGCANCDMQRGWVSVTHPDGVRMERCGCWTRHQAKLAQLGVGHVPLSLPAPEKDWTAVSEAS